MHDRLVANTSCEIVVTTWQNFGNGGSDPNVRDPRNAVWKSIAGGWTLHDCRIVDYPAGCVKVAFETSNAEMLAAVDTGL